MTAADAASAAEDHLEMGQPGTIPQPAAPEANLGVIDAARLGWRLLMGDFWLLWLMALLSILIQGAAGPAAIVVAPPLWAGLYWVLGRKIDGMPIDLGQMFEGFRQKFKISVLAGLVPYGVQFAVVLLWLPVHLLTVFGGIGLSAASRSAGRPESGIVLVPLMCMDFAVFGVLMLAATIVRFFFVFALCAVWDEEQSGWIAARRSIGLVREHAGAVIGLWALFVLIGAAGAIAGYAACCVGIVLTMPLVNLWYAAAVLYLYRSWTGRPAGTLVAGAGHESVGPPPGA